MIKSAIRYLSPLIFGVSLVGCTVYSYSDGPQPPQYATGGVVPPNYNPPPPVNNQPHYTGGVVPPNYQPVRNTLSTNLTPPTHATGGVVPPNYVPSSMNVNKHYATGGNIPSKTVKPSPKPIEPKKKPNPAAGDNPEA